MKRPSNSDSVILSAVRTPIGSFQGSLQGVSATELGSTAIAGAVQHAHIDPNCVDEVLLGCVLSAGLGQGPARQAAIGGGLPPSVHATAVNKVCGSGLKAVILASQAISNGDAKIAVAGGMESMSRAPYLMETARAGMRLGHTQLTDSLIKDGLWDAYNNSHMGKGGELCAARGGLTRQELDDYALLSYARARAAIAEGKFQEEIVPVHSTGRDRRSILVSEDEEPNRVSLDKLRSLQPAFEVDGLLTAGNSSKCNDGAAALVLASAEEAQRQGAKPVARIVGYAGAGVLPELFPLAPLQAIQKVLKLTGRSIEQIDLFEINEAFSSVSLCINRELGLDQSKVNVRGGAIALGHPIGAAGGRILTTLIHALLGRGGGVGLVSLCIGGGEALALIVESWD